MKKKTLLLVGLAWAAISYAQENQKAKLDALFTFHEKYNAFHGSVLISKKGRILLDKGYGWQDAAAQKRNQPEGIFPIYSITKTFTSTVILKLVELRKLSLTDKLSRFYPNFPNAGTITIEHLLTHTSGLYDYTRSSDMPDQSEQSFIAFMKGKPLDFDAGTSWSYSNSGYYFLGYIIEKVIGISYERAVDRYIFKPLKMTHSGFAFKYLESDNKVVGYEILTSNKQRPAIIYEPPGPYAAGGIYSTTADMHKYYTGLKNHKLISKATFELACMPKKNNYGLGWIILTMFGKTTVGHSGGGAGFTANFVQVPEDDICIIVLSNNEKDLNAVTGSVLKILYGQAHEIPVETDFCKQCLNEYAGAYQADGFAVYVFFENGRLVAQPSNGPKSVLFRDDKGLFHVEGLDGLIRFEKNGQLDVMVIGRPNGEMTAKRIRPSWGIVGSAAPSGWEGPDLKLVPNETCDKWTLQNVQLADGKIKFRFNNDWSMSLGKFQGENLIWNGTDIDISCGTYDIVLDVADLDNPTYKIEKR